MKFKPGTVVQFKSGSIMPNSAGRVDIDFSDGSLGTVITSRRREMPCMMSTSLTGQRGIELKVVEAVEILWGTGTYQTLTSTSVERVTSMNSKNRNKGA